jgi:DNA processing protein
MVNPESWIALSLVPEVGNVTFRKLLALFGTPEAVFHASREHLAGIEGIGERRATNIKQFSDWREVEKQLSRLQNMSGRVISFQSPEYPTMLRQVEDAPVLLYVKGTIQDEDRFSIAVVGSRNITPYGRVMTERLSSELSAAGFTIVSGMARGIDTFAHMSAIRSEGRTIAVLGSGIDKPYPSENRGLMERIAGSGYVASEFPLGTKPNRENFPRRNRLISGLSLGVVVVEAAAGSGALITASSALEQNREVFAVPGNVTSPNSAGTNELIQRGAKLIQKSDDILEELSPMLKGFMKTRTRNTVEITDDEKRLCDILTGEPMHIDVLSRELSLPPARALTLLLNLELKGVARQADGKRFYLVC